MAVRLHQLRHPLRESLIGLFPGRERGFAAGDLAQLQPHVLRSQALPRGPDPLALAGAELAQNEVEHGSGNRCQAAENDEIHWIHRSVSPPGGGPGWPASEWPWPSRVEPGCRVVELLAGLYPAQVGPQALAGQIVLGQLEKLDRLVLNVPPDLLAVRPAAAR